MTWMSQHYDKKGRLQNLVPGGLRHSVWEYCLERNKTFKCYSPVGRPPEQYLRFQLLWEKKCNIWKRHYRHCTYSGLNFMCLEEIDVAKQMFKFRHSSSCFRPVVRASA